MKKKVEMEDYGVFKMIQHTGCGKVVDNFIGSKLENESELRLSY
ncbi:MAG: hypothetical protein WC179_04775 [Candidatus Cloacimonadaceae bacterium]|jgi:hypothetical protein|nr:hypothetical protein [Candidatus Cloacimonadota bacterium]MDY0111615.1 hypothetical protein [Candidatus Syntrophosphaera sp.]